MGSEEEREAPVRHSTMILFRPQILVAICVLFAISLLSVEKAYGSCSNPANPIEAENCLPGTSPSVWDVDGAGDLSIQGFATDISVNVGGTVFFKINTNARAYTIDIYRVGYYGGNGARKVTSITPSAQLPQNQPACLQDATVGLTDCGNWAVSASWQVPSTAASGVYFAHLVRTDTGGDSHIVFVVRNDTGHSDILVQTSDETWQAYNYYGSGSLYGPNTASFDLTNRSYKVSYNRPFLTRGFAQESATFIFGTEYPLIEFLEANGYDVSYFTGIDAERNGTLIKNHKVYVSSGHDEYVSGNQRNNIQAARDAGVNLAFFSGNEVFWKTRWENSIDGSNTPYRTLVCYKETLGPNSAPTATSATDPMDPPIWTGTWRDPAKSPPADGGRPENNLSGTIFMVNGPGTDNDGSLSIKVPAADGKMRFWRGTSVASLPANGSYTLPQGTLGYEWDEDLDNGARPAGAFQLSTVTYPLDSDLLLDNGGTYGGGTATHHLMMYRAPSGALVFGSGTIQWSWGLNSQHDNPFGFNNTDPDTNMQQATINLFADMGAQPATLQPGMQAAIQSTDALAPTSTITSPASGSSVNAGSTVMISGTATDVGGGVVAGIEVSIDNGQTWHPANGRSNWSFSWVPNTVGTVALMSRAVDDSGNLENPQTSGGNPSGGVQVNANPQVCPCTIWNPSMAPAAPDSGDPTAVEVGVKFRTDDDGVITGLRFYKASANTGTHVGHLWTASGTLLGTVTFTGESGSGWQQVQFASPIPVAANTDYVASYFAPSGHYAGDGKYFSTAGYDDPPLHALANGVDGANGVYIYTGTPGVFPTNSFSASNYWVDVVFVNGSTFNISGNISGIGGIGAQVSLSGSTNAVTTADSNGNYQFAGMVNGTYTITPTSAGVTFSPTSKTVTLNSISISHVNFTSAVTNPLSISGTISGAGGPGATVGLTGVTTLSTTADTSGNYTFNGLIPGNYTVTPTQAGYIYTPSSQAVTLTNSNAIGINFAGAICNCTSIWQPTAAPTVADSGDSGSVEVGVKFRTDIGGTIAGLRFYKAGTNTGTHIGHIWSSTGALLASATFTNETASGWQEVLFSPSLTVTNNTVYVASYFAPAGHYPFDINYFSTSGVDNPPLHALQDGISGPDGVFAYGSTPSFPSSGYNGTNYWVDVIFAPSVPHVLSGTITGPGGPGATVTLSGGSSVSTTADASGAFTFSNTYDGTYILSASQPGYAFTQASQTVTVSGADVSGVVFTTLQNCIPCDSIWQTSVGPNVADAGNGPSVNVGLQFRADSDGEIAGLRFYKSPLNTGTHVGALWSSTGVLLGQVTFANETQSGWQQALFPSPIPVVANTTYVVSYLSPSGHYAADPNFFSTSGVDSPPLHALANSVAQNGVFVYGSSIQFPDSSFQANNYWVDVLFTPTGATHAISGTISGAGGPNATITLSGVSSATITADANGNFNFPNLADGTYTVTPSQTGFAYSAGSQTVIVNGANIAGANFGTLQNCPCVTVWSPSAGPGLSDGGDSSSVNLGVKFRTDTDGYIVGVRFYKSALNSGIHVGTLWAEDGTQLATATFTGESPSGWQQVLFDTAVPVNANTTYVASYLAPAGHYAADFNFFTNSGVDNPPLHALMDGVDGGNAVFANGGVSTFPNQSSQAANYWVDVIYATSVSYSVSGTITGPSTSGATVLLSGASTSTITADSSGNYSFGGLQNGTYTVTPVASLYTFSPASQTVNINNAHVQNVNFTAGYAISGTISGSGGPGAALTLTGASTATTVADGSGNYSFSGLPNGVYTVSPSNGSYQFTPTNQSVTVNGTSVTGINFNSQTVMTISGNLGSPGGPGATVQLTGSSNASTTADASGNYSFSGLVAGSYTVTPTNTGYAFSPASQAVTLSGSSTTANFMSSVARFNISGTISGPGGPGATVGATGPSNATTTADGSGNYTLTGLVNGSYTVAPSNGSYTFSPASQTTTINGANVSALSFGSVAISSVTLNPSSVAGGSSSTGTVTLSGPAPAGGAAVTLLSSNTGAAQVPVSVAVAANATTATFTVTTSAISSNASVTISATYGSTTTASLTVTAPVLSTVTLTPTTVPGGAVSTGTVTLSSGAPASGAVVTLSSSNTAAAQVPASVTVAANATTANFTVTTSVVSANTTATISANYGAVKTASLTVVRSLNTVTVNPISVLGGTSSTGTVTLAGAAPTGGALVPLSSSNTAAATVPASVTVAAGATTANFTITTFAVATNTSVTISGTYGVTKTGTLTVTPPTLTGNGSGVGVSPTSVVGGVSSTGTVKLTGPAPSTGAVVTLSSSNTAAAQVPATVTVAGGATTANFTITTSGVASSASVTITANYGVARTATLTVTAAALSTLTLSPTSVVGTTPSTGTVTLTGAAPPSGTVVTLSSSNTSAARVPTSVTVTAGKTTANFTIATSALASNSTVTIIAVNGTVTKTASLTVTAPTATSLTLNPSTVKGGNPSTGTVTLNGPAPTGGAVVTLSSNTTTVATVPSSVTVAAGNTSATFTVTTKSVTASRGVTISATKGTIATATLTVTP
jgi:hypothetical protein